MNVRIVAILCIPLLTPGPSAQRTARESVPPSVGPPVDVSAEGLVEPAGLALWSGGATTSFGPFDCLESIADQNTGACLMASSMPILGVLFPYPGANNVFAAPAFVGGGENNQATGPWSTVGGGYNNSASGYILPTRLQGYATVAGGRNNVASGAYATVGGGGGLFSGNTASGVFSTVAGGGGYFRGGNTASGRYGTVGGGACNLASGTYATVAGGGLNTASTDGTTVAGGFFNYATGLFATVAGGDVNTASGSRSAIAGGRDNIASGDFAAVGGGLRNTASASEATVPGGRANSAGGDFSFAAGREAKADHDGAFVWGDSYTNFPGASLKTSSAPDEFNVYCSGGARFFTNNAATAGVVLAPGGGSWSTVSNRDSKENIDAVDTRAVLQRVVALSLSTWNYRTQDDSIRHMGPMAQDFHAAFGLGVSDELIDTIDADGVALAAIQGLDELVREKDAEIEELRARVERLEALAQAALAK